MKKVVAILIIAVSFGIAIPAQAQIKLGVKGGLNLATNLSDTWKDAGNADNYTGFFIGPMVDLKIPIVGLGLDGAFMYSQRGNKIEGKTAKQQGIEIPINLKYSIGLGSLASIYFAAGPDFFFNFNSKDKFKLSGEDATLSYKKAQVALNLGFGVNLLNHLQVGLNYNMPFTDSAKAEGIGWNVLKGKSYKTKVWQVSLAYLF